MQKGHVFYAQVELHLEHCGAALAEVVEAISKKPDLKNEPLYPVVKDLYTAVLELRKAVYIMQERAGKDSPD